MDDLLISENAMLKEQLSKLQALCNFLLNQVGPATIAHNAKLSELRSKAQLELVKEA